MATELLLYTVPGTVIHPDGREQPIHRVTGFKTGADTTEIAGVPYGENPTIHELTVPRSFSRRLVGAAAVLSQLDCHQFAAYMRIGAMLDRDASQLVAYSITLPGFRLDQMIPQSFPPGSQEVITRTGPDVTDSICDVYHSMTAVGQGAQRLHVPGPELGLAYDPVLDVRGFYQNILGNMTCYATTTVITG